MPSVATIPGHGLLLVLAQPGPEISEDEFNTWYDHHTPARLALPGFNTAHRYKATDGRTPSYLALYDLDSPQVGTSDEYKALIAAASPYEKSLVPKLDVIDRRVYENVNSVCQPGFDVAVVPKYVTVVDIVVPADYDEEYNAWYHAVQLPSLIGAQGLSRIRRFKLTHAMDTPQPNVVRYATVLDWDRDTYFEDSPELNAVRGDPKFKEVTSRLSATPRRFELLKEFV